MSCEKKIENKRRLLHSYCLATEVVRLDLLPSVSFSTAAMEGLESHNGVAAYGQYSYVKVIIHLSMSTLCQIKTVTLNVFY